MISMARRWVFIHPPKTAGSSVSEALMAVSDDQAVELPGRVPGDIEVRGPVTLKKHQTLRTYRALVGSPLDDFTLICGTRHPLSRTISHYFYVSRQRRVANGDEPRDPRREWNEERFVAMLTRSVTMADFLRMPDGSVRRPDIRLETTGLESKLPDLARATGATNLAIPRVNAAPRSQFVRELEGSRHLADLVMSFQAEDYALFGYPDRPVGHAQSR